jgi:hypothetical protein
MSDTARDDCDSPWKEALERYFPEFMALFFPAIHAAIAWSRGYVFLDKELQRVVRDAELGRRYADKLIRVYTDDGTETWVLIHVEVQGEPERGFEERMYVYHYRLFDRHRVDIVSLAVLADETPGYRPREYRRGRWGCDPRFRFPVEKVLDWRGRWAELEASTNRFALVVMAHLKARESRDGVARKDWKLRLVRLMYQRGYARDDILELFRVIDWLLRLPDELEREFMCELMALEEETKMPYITSVERIGRQEGRQEGLNSERRLLLRQVRRRFGAAAAERSQALLERIAEPAVLEELGEALLDCADGEAWLAALARRVQP